MPLSKSPHLKFKKECLYEEDAVFKKKMENKKGDQNQRISSDSDVTRRSAAEK